MTKPTLAVGIAAVVLVAGAAGVWAFGGGEEEGLPKEVIEERQPQILIEDFREEDFSHPWYANNLTLMPGEMYGDLIFEGVVYENDFPVRLKFDGEIDLERRYIYRTREESINPTGERMLIRKEGGERILSRDATAEDLRPFFWRINLTEENALEVLGGESISVVRVVVKDLELPIPSSHFAEAVGFPTGTAISAEILTP